MLSEMQEDLREKRTSFWELFPKKLFAARDRVWGWLTDPAVLVYRRETAPGAHKARVLIVEFFLFVREVAREFYHIEGTSRAASLAYSTLLSLIPLMVAFTWALRKWFKELFPGFEAQIENVLNVVVPYQSPQITHHLAQFAENAQGASYLGAIAFMFIAFRLFLAVEATVNQIWKVKSSRGYRPKITAFTMLFFWGPLLMGLSFTTTRSLQNNRYLRVVFEQNFVFVLFPILVLFIAFTMLFWLVPSTRVRLSAAMTGAMITSVLFSLVRFSFGIYADYLMSGRLNIIYGTVGLAIIFLIAIEVMWVVILLGVEVSYVYQNLYGVLRASQQQIADEPRYDLYYAIRALIEIARRFDRREEAPSSYRLAEQFNTTDAQMLRVLGKLEDAMLVKETGGDWTGYVPGCDPDRISVEEVVAEMTGSHRGTPADTPPTIEHTAVAGIFNRINASTTAAIGRTSFGQLVRELYAPRAVRNEDVRES
jgi:membrane protein